MASLNLYSTEDILNELFSRYDHCIFAGLKIRDNATKITNRKSKGDSDACLGLAYKIQQFIYANWHMNEKDIPDDFED